jgi:penicillin-binding protein 2
VKQPNHSFFAAFAPRENPRIAIMCVVENSGRFGGTYAAPIVSLMIQQYINDSISAKWKPRMEGIIKTNLIPKMMVDKMRQMDSVKRAKEEEKGLKSELKNIKDTLQSEDNLTEAEARAGNKKENKPAKDTGDRKPVQKDLVLPDTSRKRMVLSRDTAKTDHNQ